MASAINNIVDGVKSTVNGHTQGQSQQTVLITGASGFLASHVVLEFLEHGYKVVGTVRSQQTADRVRETLSSSHLSNLSFAIVPDVAAPGAFDEAVKGVDGVIHTASPFRTSGISDNEKELLFPAIRGTVGILESVHKYNPSVKRVVITSSFAAILDMAKASWPGHTYSEKDWNPIDYEAAKTADGPTAYCASKKFAEKAAFDFVEKEKPNFSVATICPPMVYGPTIQPVSSLDHLNESSADIYRLMNGSLSEVPPTAFWAMVDVRDVAKAHRLAYELPQAANQRYFVTAGSYSYQMLCDIIRAEVPEVRDRTPEGKPGSGLGQEVYRVDNSKSRKELGLEYTPMNVTIRDAARSLLELEKKLGKSNSN